MNDPIYISRKYFETTYKDDFETQARIWTIRTVAVVFACAAGLFLTWATTL